MKFTIHRRIELCLAVIFAVLIAVCFGSCSLEAQLAQADKLYEDGVYYKVEKKYRKIQRRIKKNKPLYSQVQYKIGECNRILFNAKKAEVAYLQSIKSGNSDPVVLLHLAKVQQSMGNYLAASKNYEKYLGYNPTFKEAIDGLVACDIAKELLKTPSKYIIAEAKELNSRKSSDFSPSFAGSGGESIFFSSNRNVSKKQKKSEVTGWLNFDIYESTKNNLGKWSKPKFTLSLNDSEDDGVTSFSSDGKTIYFTRSVAGTTENIGTKIFVSNKSGGEWSEPAMIKLFVDSTITAAHPSISSDGNKLYFVSDYKESFGGTDIFVSHRLDRGWSHPENMGEKINTTGNEMFPHVVSDSVFYFASDGHQGFGGLDIYVAKLDPKGEWHVENMLAPFNSPSDDFGITFLAGTQSGFFSSNRNNNRHLDNIYSFALPETIYEVAGKVADENGEPIGSAMIKIVSDNGRIIKIRTKRDGTYKAKLDKNSNYVMMASAKGYLNSSSKNSTVGLDNSKTFDHNYTLPTINKPVKMENIFYEFGKWTISAESESELNSLVKLLNDNPNIAIELAAHTDSVGGSQANMELSQKRAKSVMDYLIVKGIAADRLSARGYGETMPVVADKNIVAKYPFIKEGESLVAKYILTLTPEQQAICNQINRRTEFRVTRTTYNIF